MSAATIIRVLQTQSPARGAGTGCVAIDLGANTVRVVEMEWGAGGDLATARIVRRGSAPLPFNVWSDLHGQRDLVAAAIRQALSSAGITARSVVASLPRRLVTLRLVRLPHAPPDQMRGMVMFEAQQHILFSLDEVVLSYHVVPSSDSAQDDLGNVLLAAARRSLIADLMAVFDQIGVELRQLSVSALALAEHIRDSLEPTAVIDLEPGNLDVAVVYDQKLLFSRASALEAGPSVTTLDTQSAMEAGGGNAERRMAEEVARSFTAYQNEFRNRPLARVFRVGSGADSLNDTLSGLLDMPVTALQTRLMPSGDSEIRAYATAIGTALQSRPDSLAPINLIPGEREEKRAAQARGVQRRVALALAVLVLIAGVVWAQGVLAQKEKLQRDTLAANNQLNDISDKVAARQKTFDKQNQIATELSKGLDRNHPAVDVLVALNSALPHTADIWLNQFTFDRNSLLTMRGQTKSAMAATDLVLALQHSGAFNTVHLVYLGDAQDTDNGSGTGMTPGMVAPRRSMARPALRRPRTNLAPAPIVPPIAAPQGSPAVPGAPGGAPPFPPFNGRFPRRPGANGLPPGLPGNAVPGGNANPVGIPGGPPGPIPGNTNPPGAPAPQPQGSAGAPPGVNLAAGSVPSITLPPGTGTPRLPQPAASTENGPGVPRMNSTLTSFVITCRINAHRLSLLPKTLPTAPKSVTSTIKAKAATSKASGDTQTESGDVDADTQ